MTAAKKRLAEAEAALIAAENAHREASGRYFVIGEPGSVTSPEETFGETAAAELTALRRAAQEAQDRYVQAVGDAVI